MSQHILIAEDEEKIAHLLSDYLKASGYETTLVHRGDDVIPTVDEVQPQAVLLDIMMPGEDGLSVLKKIRAQSDLPVLMLTARVEEIDRILGLELGADDYICKPFSPREVVARLKTVLRRAGNTTTTTINQDFKLDSSRYECAYETGTAALSAIEFQILQRMSKEPGRIFSRQQLMSAMYNDHRVVNDRTIDSHIKKLRKKLAEQFTDTIFIHSIYGVGYRFSIEKND